MQERIQDLVSVFFSSSTTRVKTKASYCVLCGYGLLCSYLADCFGHGCRALFPLFDSFVLSETWNAIVGAEMFRWRVSYFWGLGERNIELHGAISILLDTRSLNFIRIEEQEWSNVCRCITRLTPLTVCNYLNAFSHRDVLPLNNFYEYEPMFGIFFAM